MDAKKDNKDTSLAYYEGILANKWKIKKPSGSSLLRFLKELSKCGLPSHAAKKVRIPLILFLKEREENPNFALAWEAAMEHAIDALELEARRRAVEGIEVPVFYKGEQVATKREYSDQLLMFLLKGRRKQVFAGDEGQAIGGKVEIIINCNVPEPKWEIAQRLQKKVQIAEKKRVLEEGKNAD